MRKVTCSVLQSQTFAASSYVSADGSSVEESDVDLDEVISTTDFYAVKRTPPCACTSLASDMLYLCIHLIYDAMKPILSFK